MNCNTPIQEKTGSRMEARSKGPSQILAAKTNAFSKKFQDGERKH